MADFLLTAKMYTTWHHISSHLLVSFIILSNLIIYLLFIHLFNYCNDVFSVPNLHLNRQGALFTSLISSTILSCSEPQSQFV